MIDTHCHILHNIDDGPQTLEESVEMARVAAADGIKVIVATPHWNPGENAPAPALIEERVAELQAAVARLGVDLRIEPGAEAALTPDLAHAVARGQVPALAGSRYLLVEILPYTGWDLVRRVLFELQLHGVGIVLAHPERAACIHERYDRVRELKAGGILMQVVASGLSGAVGPSARRVARRLLRDGLVDILATDAHGPRDLAPRLTPLERAVERLAGRGAFHELTVRRPSDLLDSRA